MADPHDKLVYTDRTYCSKQDEEAAVTWTPVIHPNELNCTWYHMDEIEHSSQGFSPLLHKAEEEPINVEWGPTDSKH